MSPEKSSRTPGRIAAPGTRAPCRCGSDVERQEQDDERHDAVDGHPLEAADRHADGKAAAGEADEVLGRDVRREHRGADERPAQLPAREEVALRPGLPAHDHQADEEHRREVGGDDQPVDEVERHVSSRKHHDLSFRGTSAGRIPRESAVAGPANPSSPDANDAPRDDRSWLGATGLPADRGDRREHLLPGRRLPGGRGPGAGRHRQREQDVEAAQEVAGVLRRVEGGGVRRRLRPDLASRGRRTARARGPRPSRRSPGASRPRGWPRPAARPRRG